MSFSHLNLDIIIKSTLFSKVASNFGHRDMRHIREEFSEGTTTLSDSSNLCTSGYEETRWVEKRFGKFQTIFEAEVAIFFRTDNRRQCPTQKYHPSLKRTKLYTKSSEKRSLHQDENFQKSMQLEKAENTEGKHRKGFERFIRVPKSNHSEETRAEATTYAIFTRLEQ